MWWKWLYILVANVLFVASFFINASKEITLILDIFALLFIGISAILDKIENLKQ